MDLPFTMFVKMEVRSTILIPLNAAMCGDEMIRLHRAGYMSKTHVYELCKMFLEVCMNIQDEPCSG